MTKEIDKEFDKILSKHLFICVDYSISSKKVDNEILLTTGQAISRDIKQFLHQKIDQAQTKAIKKEQERISEEIRKLEETNIDYYMFNGGVKEIKSIDLDETLKIINKKD